MEELKELIYFLYFMKTTAMKEKKKNERIHGITSPPKRKHRLKKTTSSIVPIE